MATGAIQLPGRLASLPYFAAAWVLSYLVPHLIAATFDFAAMFVLYDASDLAWEIESWIVWVGLLPVLYAVAQWMLMRRCMSAPIPWAVATYVGTFMARCGVILIPEPEPRLLFANSMLADVFLMLVPWVGASLAATLAAALPPGLCFGLAGSIPQAIVLPVTRTARIAWVAIMFPVELVSTAVGEGLYRQFSLDLADLTLDGGFLLGAVVLSYVPRSCAWLLVAVAGGVLIHAILKRNLGAADDSILQRFD